MMYDCMWQPLQLSSAKKVFSSAPFNFSRSGVLDREKDEPPIHENPKSLCL